MAQVGLSIKVEPRIRARGLSKSFHLHTQGGARIDVLDALDFEARAGECVVLYGPSGAGKSTLLRLLYGNYRVQEGSLEVWHDGEWVEMRDVPARRALAIRRATIGYVSQFLRVIPRVSSRDIVAGPLIDRGVDADAARERAGELLGRLRIPERLWDLAPATFSGGEQQRVNIAHGFIADYPILILDEPTASLDAANRQTVIDMILEKKRAGVALVGIFHDEEVRDAVGDKIFKVEPRA